MLKDPYRCHLAELGPRLGIPNMIGMLIDYVELHIKTPGIYI